MFTRKTITINDYEEQSPPSERSRKLSTESNSGVFTITESFEYGKDREAFYPSALPDCPSPSTTASISSILSTIRSKKRGKTRTGTRQVPQKWKSNSSLSSWRTYLSDWRNRILTVRNMLRLVAYGFCVFYCFKYAHHIFSQYSHYETIVTLEYRSQRTTIVPAISLCSHCILCTLNEHRIRNLPIQHILIENNTWHWIKRNNRVMKQVDMAVDCRITNIFHDTHIDCGEIIRPLVSMQEGHKCVTFFSNLDGQIARLNDSMRKSITFDFNYTPKITMLINGTFLQGRSTGTTAKNFTDLNMNDPKRATFRRTGVYIKLHERTLLTDMKDLNYHKIRPGVKTQISFTKRSVNLLPKPYKTNCFNYSANQKLTAPPWRFNNKVILDAGSLEVDSGFDLYRSRGECIKYCLWRLLSTGRCVNFFSIIDYDVHRAELLFRQARWMKNDFESHPGESHVDVADLVSYNHPNQSMLSLRYCFNSESQYIEYVNAKNRCVSHCLEDCHNEYFYEDNIQEVENDQRLGHWRNQTQVTIEWAVGPVTNVYHNERMDISEFFGTLGGHFHIWIGLSVPFVVKLIIRLNAIVRKFVIPHVRIPFKCF